jgi:thiol-disulfide isomerase/thioredoxin
MQRIVIFIFLVLGTTYLHAQTVPWIKGDFIEQVKSSKSDTIYVLNFWATWCKPCVHEMPAFERINAAYKNRNVKVILVSNDLRKEVDTRLKPFIKKNNLKSTVLFMSETNSGKWIDKVDKAWSGVIPCTLVVRGSSNYEWFHEGELSYEELEKVIKPLIK